MIIFRYILREVLMSTLAVCTILLMILISGRLVKYMAKVASSTMDVGAMIALLGYRIPGLLELTLPLAFFLALLLCLGRMHADNEISVLNACGVSERRLLGYVLLVASLFAIGVAYLSLILSPLGMQRAALVAEAQRSRGVFDEVIAGKFYPFRDGDGVIHADDVTAEQALGNVFLVLSTISSATLSAPAIVVFAKAAEQQNTDYDTKTYIVLNEGLRYEGVPGSTNYHITEFEEYGIRLSESQPYEERVNLESISTSDLMISREVDHNVALQWRLSIPLMMFVVALLAWPLSRAKPRQGQYSKLLPAILLYLFYLVGLNALRGSIESGVVPSWVTLLPMHCLLIMFALVLIFRGSFKRYRAHIRSK
ncbi:MAG: LPS export ABC transporter permease LptF [Porticoccaceae bacterium]|nr:LPS export ABC transporter permease LptF [Porticoccaceae bacterium]